MVLNAHEWDTDLRVRTNLLLLKPPRCSSIIHCLFSELTSFFHRKYNIFSRMSRRFSFNNYRGCRIRHIVTLKERWEGGGKRGL